MFFDDCRETWVLSSPCPSDSASSSCSPTGAHADVSVSLGNVLGLVARGDTVYWTEIGGTGVYMAPATGGPRAIYFAGEATEGPGYLAHDDGALYWADRSTGAVRKIAFK